MKREKLKRPHANSCAAQCRQMGIVVGDTIVGRETYSPGQWIEAKLTAIFIGKEECVFKTMRRSNDSQRWHSDGESSNWTLECRDWYKLRPNAGAEPREASASGTLLGSRWTRATDDPAKPL